MGTLVQLQFRYYIICVVFLPLSAMVFCVAWTLLYDFESATSTHCRVINFLPSISTAIGGYTPQKYVWRIGIALHSAPRFLIAAMYHNHFCNTLFNKPIWQKLVLTAFVLQSFEILSLVGLSYISSTDNFPMHEKLFVTFIICAFGHMLLLYMLLKYGTKQQQTRLEKHSLHYKFLCGIINFFSFSLAVYFYFRHNWYCESGMYSLFALSEYFVVLSNMGYHLTAIFDFSDQIIIVSSI